MRFFTSPKLRRAGVLLTLVALYFGVARTHASATLPTPTPALTDCTLESTSHVISPDGAWDAVLHRDFCEAAYAFTAHRSYTVTIVARSGPAQQGDVFNVDDEGGPQGRPVVSWISSNALQITAMKSPGYGVQRSSFGNIRISYAFTPPTDWLWSADFTGYSGSPWATAWGIVSTSIPAGHSDAESDSVLSGQILHVHYDSGSASLGCTDCGAAVGGAQFDAHEPGLGGQSSLYLQYSIKFPVGFDFGKKGTGKLPGLFGGNNSSCSTSSTSRTPGCWNTRLAWHSPGTVAPTACPASGCAGEIYLQNACGAAGSHTDIGRGSWTFAPDGRWHTIEQFVNTAGQGSVTLWYDGVLAVNAATLGCPNNSSVSGISFASFYGGSTTSYGPGKATDAYFGDFRTSILKL